MSEKPAYWAVIPAKVRYDTVVPPNAKLLYAEISALCGTDGRCWAGNDYFAELYACTTRTIQRLLLALEQRGYIRIAKEAGPDGGAPARVICAEVNPAAGYPAGDGPGPEDQGGDKNVREGGDKIVARQFCRKIKEEEEEIYNTPLKPPQGGRVFRRAVSRAAPTWKPERFTGFWQYYPRHEARQRAIAAWDKLQPSDGLIAAMGRALTALKRSPDWQRGVGIPYAATWLNQRRWEDAEHADDWRGPFAADAGGWADDPEVI